MKISILCAARRLEQMFNCLCLDTSTLSQVAKFDGVVLEIYGLSQMEFFFGGEARQKQPFAYVLHNRCS